MNAVETKRDQVPREFIGRARSFLRELHTADTAYGHALRQLVQPIIARVYKFPERRIRADVLSVFERAWRTELDHPVYRIGWQAKLAGRKPAISEIRLTHLMLTGWEEPNCAISFVSFQADRERVSLRCRYRFTSSLYAIGRFFERNRISTNEELRLAMIATLATLPDSLPDGPVTVPTLAGQWKGLRHQLISVNEPGPILAMRTYLSSEMQAS